MNKILIRCIGALTALLMVSAAWGASVSIVNSVSSTGVGVLGVDAVEITMSGFFDGLDDVNEFTVDSSYAQILTINSVDEILSFGTTAITISPGDSLYDSMFPTAGIYTADLHLMWLHHNTVTEINTLTHVYASSADFLFTPATVPIPPAVWLFGSALGVMGWMRRKITS